MPGQPEVPLQCPVDLPVSVQGSREPGETLPRKLKRILRQEHWLSFANLLTRGMEVFPACLLCSTCVFPGL